MLEKIRENFQKHRKKFTVVFWVVISSLIILGPLLLHVVPVEEAMFVIVLILLAYLELLGNQSAHYQESIETRVKNLESLLKAPIPINSNQTSSNSRLVDFIKTEHPRQVDMLEYSSTTVQELIRHAVHVRSRIRLLLKAPATAISYYQGERICERIRTIYNDFFEANLEIRCYSKHASLRGRKLDDRLINVGWYTYDIRDLEMSEDQIWGHNNPLITLESEEEGFSKIKRFFDKVFENMWKNAVPLKDICTDCEFQRRETCDVKDATNWLESVSSYKSSKQVDERETGG